jgi:opacity protein-like surface antigen
MALKHVLLGTAVALVASAGAAQAEIVTPTGWYLSIAAGANWIPDGKFSVTDITDGGEGELSQASWDTGYAVAAAVGYDFGDHWRAELEVAYRQNNVDLACKPAGTDCDSSTRIWELSEMVNVLYDFHLGGNWSAALGAGIGGKTITSSRAS